MSDLDRVLAQKAAEIGTTLAPDAAARVAARIAEQANSAEAIDAGLRELSDRYLKDLAEDAPHLPTKAWSAMSRDERRAQRARNELARRQREKERQAEQDAEAQQRTAQQQTAGEAQRAEVRRQLRAASPGLSEAGLEAAVDRVLGERAAASLDRVLAEKRRQLAGGF